MSGVAPAVPAPAARRIGVLGGTFDPPHIGHLVVAECARVELHLDEVRLVPTGDPWMKSTVASAEQRLAMTRAAVGADPFLAVDDREVRRGGPTYTVDTLSELTREEPSARLLFLVGADAAADLGEWDRIEEAERLATFVCVTRPGAAVVGRAGLTHLEIPAIDVSSTDLRRRVAGGRAVRYLTPPAVEAYIRANALYGGPAR